MGRAADKIPKHLLPRLPTCVLRLLSAEKDEIVGRDPLDWAIDKDIKGKDRKILREALAVMVETSPALAHLNGKAPDPDEPPPDWPEPLDLLSQVWLDKLLQNGGD
jgi:hypothetical protein